MTVLSKFQSFWIAELLCWQRCVSIVTFQGQVCENSPSPAWPIGPIAPCDKQQQTTEIFLQLIIIKSQITSLIYHYYVYEYRQTEQDLYTYLFSYSFTRVNFWKLISSSKLIQKADLPYLELVTLIKISLKAFCLSSR